MQWEFTADVLARTKGLHRALQTSGYGPEEAFRAVLKETDYVLFDLKLADREQHKTDTGVDNGPILRNYEILLASGKPHVVRIPLIRESPIPGKTWRRWLGSRGFPGGADALQPLCRGEIPDGWNEIPLKRSAGKSC